MINKSSESPALEQDDQEMLNNMDFMQNNPSMAQEELDFYNNLQRVTNNEDESGLHQGAVGAVIDQMAQQMEENQEMDDMYD